MNKVAYYQFYLFSTNKNREIIKRFAYLLTLIFFGMLAETGLFFTPAYMLSRPVACQCRYQEEGHLLFSDPAFALIRPGV